MRSECPAQSGRGSEVTGQNEADRQEVPGHVISLSESVPPAQSKVQNFAASDIITGNKPTW